MDLGIKGRKALVTGGAQGIGRAITLQLLEAGCDVTVTSRSSQALEAIRHMRCTGIYRELDEEGIEAFRGRKFDILVNNAGSTLDVIDPEASIDDFRKVFWLNYEVPRELTKMLLPYMREQRWGRIVNISSCSGIENRGPVAFGSAKAALTAFTRGMGRILAAEAPGVVMTAILPGLVLTEGGHWERVLKERPDHAEKYLREQSPIARFGRPEEISPMVAFCCSAMASFMHGAIIPVDAGLSKGYQVQNWL